MHQLTLSRNTSTLRRQWLSQCRRPSSSTAPAMMDDDVYVPYENSRQKPSTSERLPPLYVSATRQHVGKTTTSMALLSGLQKRFNQVGFMKPVGQVCLEVADENDPHKTLLVDKDAVLVKEHFRLDHLKYSNISPVTIPRGYTKDYLDGHIGYHEQEALIHRAYNEMADSDIVLCEGTGHMAVGSICQVNNAQVASWLDAKMVLVANGGLGNTFDELELNRALCDREGVDVVGVIINKLHAGKVEQTREYITKALNLHWGDVPLVGCIPDRPFLGCPALADFESLFHTELLTGRQHLLRHYRVPDLNLVATSLQVFLRDMRNNPSRNLYVCHASRNDILLGFLLEAERIGSTNENESALIVTGTDEHPLSDQVLDIVHAMKDEDTAPPVMIVPHSTNFVMDSITKYTPKLNYEDSHRASTAVLHYEPFIDFDMLLQRSGHSALQQQRQHAST